MRRELVRLDADAVIAHAYVHTSSPCASTITSMLAPSLENFAALLMRFAKTCESRIGSASTVTRSRGKDDGERLTPLLDEWLRRLHRRAAGRARDRPAPS